MELLVPVLSIAGAVTLGAMSPGPSFVMVARVAVAGSRAEGIAAALGMGAGGVFFAFAALLGLHLVLGAVPWLYLGLKIAGGAYLVYLGYRTWRGASEPLRIADAEGGTTTLGRAFGLGLFTQVSNPKTAIVYASIFVALLPREVPAPVMLVLPLLVFIVEGGWYSIVALALSAPLPRAAYLRSKASVDRAAGAVLALLGLKLMALR